MAVLRQPLPIWEEYVHDTRIPSSLASSFFICLSLAVICLGIFFVRSARRTNYSSSHTTPPPYSTYTMSDQTSSSFPPPSADAKDISLLPDNPLTGVYFPITSGQVAALATSENAESQPAHGADPAPQNTETPTSSQAREIIARGYVQYFEDRTTDEAWQRKVFVYGENKQDVT